MFFSIVSFLVLVFGLLSFSCSSYGVFLHCCGGLLEEVQFCYKLWLSCSF